MGVYPSGDSKVLPPESQQPKAPQQLEDEQQGEPVLTSSSQVLPLPLTVIPPGAAAGAPSPAPLSPTAPPPSATLLPSLASSANAKEVIVTIKLREAIVQKALQVLMPNPSLFLLRPCTHLHLIL